MYADKHVTCVHRRRSGHLAAAMFLVTGLALLVSAAVPLPVAELPEDAVPALRIGTYDSRAIAIAYARSAHLQAVHGDLMRRRAEAEEGGDEPRVREIEALGGSLQFRLRLQGFSTAPVDDLLDAVRDRLPEVARGAGVAAITRSVDFHDPMVEIVDVTDALVALFEPDARVLSLVAELRSQPPLALETVAHAHGRQ